jgi:hypothetical protein
MQHARGLYVYCCNSVFRRSAIPQGVVTESNYRTSITYYLHLWIEAYFEMRALALLVFLHAAGGEGKRISSPPIAALQRLRGGGTAYQQQPSYRRYYPAPEPRDTSRQPPALQDGEMSDAERVFVVQQFARQEVRARFLRRVFLIVALQVALTAAVMALVRSTPQLLYTLARASPMVLLAPLAPALMLQLSPSASQRVHRTSRGCSWPRYRISSCRTDGQSCFRDSCCRGRAQRVRAADEAGLHNARWPADLRLTGSARFRPGTGPVRRRLDQYRAGLCLCARLLGETCPLVLSPHPSVPPSSGCVSCVIRA